MRCGAMCVIVAVDLDLIEPVLAPVDDEEVAEAVDPGHVEMRATGAISSVHSPGASIARGAQPEIRVGVVGVDEQRAVMLVDVIFAPDLARRDEDRRRPADRSAGSRHTSLVT